MRLFIAINLNETMKQTLLDIQNAMRGCGIEGNYTPEENMHLTLAFIGEYEDPDYVMDVIEEITYDEFEISLDRAGNFGNLWWAGIAKDPALTSLAKKLRRALADAGIPYDRKKFSPHITLIRNPSYKGKRLTAIPEQVLRSAEKYLEKCAPSESAFTEKGDELYQPEMSDSEQHQPAIPDNEQHQPEMPDNEQHQPESFDEVSNQPAIPDNEQHQPEMPDNEQHQKANSDKSQVGDLSLPGTPAMTVEYFSLMRSDRGKHGMIYTELDQVYSDYD